MKKYKLVIISGSPQGAKSNSAQLIQKKIKPLTKQFGFELKTLHLEDKKDFKQAPQNILKSDAVIFMSGTYWDSWGSPLQNFLEVFTDYEGHPDLLGKPAGAIILMHSVGGKGVLSRLQGVLNTYGFLIPPMAGVVLSLAGQLAQKAKSSHQEDFWSADDIEILLENLKHTIRMQEEWKKQNNQWLAWPVDKKNPKRLWFKE